MNYNKIVIKIGTTTLIQDDGEINFNRINKLAKVVSMLKDEGKEIIIVTSGAVGVGKNILGQHNKKLNLWEKQAFSSIGQCKLMAIYGQYFTEYNHTVSQVLLTKTVFKDNTATENAKNTFETLLKMNIIPIVNENDAVSTEELGFSDNDTLSAHVTLLTGSDLLIILSDIDGLYDKDPNKYSDAKLIEEVKEINEHIESLAGGANSTLGTGGMKTKILASRLCMARNIPCVIAKGDNPEVIEKILKGEKVGTLFSRV
ncbi:MAG: glutamate 5-kinase [Lachnospirales bacterium]